MARGGFWLFANLQPLRQLMQLMHFFASGNALTISDIQMYPVFMTPKTMIAYVIEMPSLPSRGYP